MRIVIVEQGRKPYEAELECDLETMQRCVSGAIEVVYEPGRRDAALICNDEGKLLGMPPSRAIRSDDGQVVDVIAGPFFIAYAPIESENFLSMPDELREKYLEKFRQPERFFRTPEGIKVVKFDMNAEREHAHEQR